MGKIWWWRTVTKGLGSGKPQENRIPVLLSGLTGKPCGRGSQNGIVSKS